jgi:hypothetical protein
MRKWLGFVLLCVGAGFIVSSNSITGNVIGFSSSVGYFDVVGFLFLLGGLVLLVSGKSLRALITSAGKSNNRVDSFENNFYQKSSISPVFN